MFVAVIGLLGAVAAAMVSKYDWRTAYYVGGVLGIILLLLRLGTFESGMYKTVAKASEVSKGNMLMLFTNWKRFYKYLCCIFIGSPLWYVVGILITQSPEIGKALGAKETLSAGTGILYSYVGISVGGIFAAILAQLTKSRKLTMFIYLLLFALSVVAYLSAKGITNSQFIWLCFFMGFAVGYWATFVTIAAEQFGTNIRSTVTTTVPNFIRGSLIPINALFNVFVLHYGMINSAYIMMAILTVLALFCLSQLKESFHKDLDYVEVS